MLISHEVPIPYLEQSRKFNDYDYALVHLYSKFPVYKQFYIDSIKKYNRRVILDNSIFELETMFDSDIFAQNIIETNPSEYIIPDALEDCNKTIESCDNWLDTYSDLKGVKIGVVQGKNYNELIECYKYMSDKVDKIAISFDYSLYEDKDDSRFSTNKYHQWMIGRIKFLDYLESNSIINRSKPHHLLGCSLPQEFKAYRNIPYIESVDTSNPVVHAILNKKYSVGGLKTKESIKLIDLINTDNINPDLLDYNIQMFRYFCSGDLV